MIDILNPDNRLLPRIAKARDAIERRVRLDTGEPVAADFDPAVLDRQLDNSPTEHFQYQQMQAEAHAMGRLTSSEAHTIYAALGEVPAANGWAEGTDLATKLVINEVMMELLLAKRRIAQ